MRAIIYRSTCIYSRNTCRIKNRLDYSSKIIAVAYPIFASPIKSTATIFKSVSNSFQHNFCLFFVRHSRTELGKDRCKYLIKLCFAFIILSISNYTNCIRISIRQVIACTIPPITIKSKGGSSYIYLFGIITIIFKTSIVIMFIILYLPTRFKYFNIFIFHSLNSSIKYVSLSQSLNICRCFRPVIYNRLMSRQAQGYRGITQSANCTTVASYRLFNRSFRLRLRFYNWFFRFLNWLFLLLSSTTIIHKICQSAINSSSFRTGYIIIAFKITSIIFTSNQTKSNNSTYRFLILSKIDFIKISNLRLSSR